MSKQPLLFWNTKCQRVIETTDFGAGLFVMKNRLIYDAVPDATEKMGTFFDSATLKDNITFINTTSSPKSVLQRKSHVSFYHVD